MRWAAASCAAALAGACGASDGADPQAVLVATIEVDAGAEPAALAVLGDGRLIIGERRTGRVVAVDVSAPETRTVLATVAVDPDAAGQRGLLGVAVGGDGDDVYAAWTRATDDRIVVAQIAPGDERLIWEGPAAADLANGGHLELDGDGAILVGIGDIQEPDRVDDPNAPNGKLLALDPDGAADQRPAVRSGGWNNPFAFAVTARGEVWVADNAPGELPERLGRGDADEPLVELEGRRAPSALVELGDDRLGLCGFLDGDLVGVDLEDGPTVGDVLLEDVCRTGAVALGAGMIGVSDGELVRIFQLSSTT